MSELILEVIIKNTKYFFENELFDKNNFIKLFVINSDDIFEQINDIDYHKKLIFKNRENKKYNKNTLSFKQKDIVNILLDFVYKNNILSDIMITNTAFNNIIKLPLDTDNILIEKLIDEYLESFDEYNIKYCYFDVIKILIDKIINDNYLFKSREYMNLHLFNKNHNAIIYIFNKLDDISSILRIVIIFRSRTYFRRKLLILLLILGESFNKNKINGWFVIKQKSKIKNWYLKCKLKNKMADEVHDLIFVSLLTDNKLGIERKAEIYKENIR